MKIMNMRKGSWGKLTAFFDVCTDEGFIIKGFKLVNGINGMFVGFPSQKGNDDEYYDTIWLTEEVRESMREKLSKQHKSKSKILSEAKLKADQQIDDKQIELDIARKEMLSMLNTTEAAEDRARILLEGKKKLQKVKIKIKI